MITGSCEQKPRIHRNWQYNGNKVVREYCCILKYIILDSDFKTFKLWNVYKGYARGNICLKIESDIFHYACGNVVILTSSGQEQG